MSKDKKKDETPKIKEPNFLASTLREMGRVSWPTGRETLRMTSVVIATVIFFALFIGLVDIGINQAQGFLYGNSNKSFTSAPK
jgi:preprotein translocase subunit SecE